MKLEHERAQDELTDNAALASVFARQAEVSLMVRQAARIIYDAKLRWIGGGGLDWSDLTPLQQRNECQAVEVLVKGGSK